MKTGRKGANSGVFSVKRTVMSDRQQNASLLALPGQRAAPLRGFDVGWLKNGCVPQPRWEAAGGGESLPPCQEEGRPAGKLYFQG